MVQAHHRKAVKRHILDELVEGLLDPFEVPVVVEMFRIDIGDDGDVGRQLDEGAVAFVGLHDHPLPAAQAGIGAVGVDDATVDHGRVQVAGVEQGRHQRGCGCLAVRATDGDGCLEPHDLGQHFSATHDGQGLCTRGDQLRIVLLDSRRDDDNLGFAQIVTALADLDLDPHVAQALHIGVERRIRALHSIALVVQDFGNAAHADAANPDKMDRPDIARHFHER